MLFCSESIKVRLYRIKMLFLPRLLHHLPIPKFPLILGVSRFLAFLLVTVFLPIAPANEKFAAILTGNHDAIQSFTGTTAMFFYGVFGHHMGKGEPCYVKDDSTSTANIMHPVLGFNLRCRRKSGTDSISRFLSRS